MNDTNRSTATEPLPVRGDILASATLSDVETGAAVSLRSGRGPRVLFVPHDAHCAGCVAWLSTVAADARAIDDWGARITVILPHADTDSGDLRNALPETVQVLADPEDALRLPAGSLSVVDEWGEVYFATVVGPEHALPDAEEIAEWARYVAIQCPECEGPEGEWRAL